MKTSTDVQARHLADEIERRSKGRATFDPAARERLTREFQERLDGSRVPDRLFITWEQNLDRYVARAFPGSGSVFVTEDFVRGQFKLCNELCPPPKQSRSGRAGESDDHSA